MILNLTIFRFSIFLFTLIIMFTIETIRPKRVWGNPRIHRLLFHLTLAVFNTALLRIVASKPLLNWGTIVYENKWGISSFFGLSGLIEILITLVVLDLFDYWWHRFNHRTPFLWRFHKVHHVDTHVDITTALRFHPCELLLSAVVKAIWILILGPTILSYTLFVTALTAAALFHHSNIDFPDRIETLVRSFFVTPRFHAAHHTVNKRTGNANFSAILIFWDKIFGTYQEPDYEEMKKLGLSRGRDTYLSFISTLKGPFSNEY